MNTVKILEALNVGDNVVWARIETPMLIEEQHQALKNILLSCFDHVETVHNYELEKVFWTCSLSGHILSRRQENGA